MLHLLGWEIGIVGSRETLINFNSNCCEHSGLATRRKVVYLLYLVISEKTCSLTCHIFSLSFMLVGGDIAELVERLTGVPLM